MVERAKSYEKMVSKKEIQGTYNYLNIMNNRLKYLTKSMPGQLCENISVVEHLEGGRWEWMMDI